MEESTINDLYMKYTNEVEGALEEDRYFQYLFEMIQAGDNTLEQKNRVLHKVVDERWLTVVEEGIESIFNIVDKPRRFIATSEEVVPVALAKKITADSVRHLSQNTQFIASNEAGEIQPTRILNVTTEESYDLYENRFVYHLIQRLFAFVDKRTDIIFWSTGDETCNVMSMESKIDDAYEEISYKVEMTIKNRQSYVENDTDNMDLFKRIDRVRRMSRTLRASSFCDIMNGCAKVRSPIQRTNLMMKDPDYRACYKLWQFIEGYDEVGYTIEEQDSALQFDEEYLLQMYINMITNYTVFKSLLESDPRKMSELATEKREPVKPKFIKKIEEQIVEDRNIEDVEIRKVFVEEVTQVTQAQLDAEAKLEDETRRREELEQSMQSLEWQLDSTMQDLQFLEQMKEELENQKAEIEAQLEIEQKAQAELKEAMERAEIEAKNEIEVIRSETTETIEAERREKEETIEKIQSEAQAKVQQFSQEKEKAYKEVEKSLRQVEAAKKESKQYQAEAAETRLSAEQTIKETNEAAKKTVEEVQRNAEEAILKVQKETEEAVKTARREAEEAVRRAQKEAERAVQKAQEEAEQSVKAAKEEADKTVQSVKADAEETVKQVKQEAEKEVETAKKKQLQAEKEKEKAVAKSEANSLSRYILNALQERKERKNSKEDDNNQ